MRAHAALTRELSARLLTDHGLSKTPVLESLDALKRRVDEAARYIDLDRVAIGPQCGFASTVAGNPVTEDDERRKLSLVVEAARQFWP